MGNNNSTISNAATLDSYIGELSDLAFVKSLSSSRFLKCVLGKHQDGQVVVKLFIKSGSINLRDYIRQSEAENSQLLELPNALSYQRLQETDRAVYLVRQYIASNLYDRVSTRPFLAPIEKRWIVYQLLHGLQECHARGIRHGDIKTENILVTSWNWVYLTDFAFFKPTYLPENNPADFSYFFDTSYRRTCYIAPERFHGPSEVKKGPVTDAMDIFSLGCVIAELFLEGISLFDLSQMFQYRAGEYDPKYLLDKIEDLEIRSLIGHMINIDPDKRYSAERYLQHWQRRAFPHYFTTFMHEYLALITEDQRHHMEVPSRDIDQTLDRIFFEFDKISFFLKFDDVEHKPYEMKKLHTSELSIPNYRRTPPANMNRADSENGALIFLTIMLTGLRNTTQTISRIRACETIVALSDKISDEAKLDRVVPSLIELLKDDAPEVRAVALWSLTQVLGIVRILTPVNAFIFVDYILPRLTESVFTSPVTVIIRYAQCITIMIQTANRFSEMAYALSQEGLLALTGADEADSSPSDGHGASVYLRSIREMQNKILRDHVIRLLADHGSTVKRTILPFISDLAVFFGLHRSIDILLGHVISYLNDEDWLLRITFFEHVVSMGQYLGRQAVETFIVPVMIQALTDPEDLIVEKVLSALSTLCSNDLVIKPASTTVCAIVVRFLIHPSLWIREAATGYVAAVCHKLSPADLYSIVYPLIRPFLRMEIMYLQPVAILQSLRRPMPQQALDVALKWAMDSSADKAGYWATQAHQRDFSGIMTRIEPFSAIPNRSDSSRSTVAISKASKPTSLGLGRVSREDEIYVRRLKDAGLHSEDEWKINALREYIWRRANRKTEQDRSQINKYALEMSAPLPTTIFFDGLVQERVKGEPRKYKHNAAHDVHAALRVASYNLESNRSKRTSSRTSSNIRHAAKLPNGANSKTRLLLNSSSKPLSQAKPANLAGTSEPGSDRALKNDSTNGSRASSINGDTRSLSLRTPSGVNLPGMTSKAHAEVGTTTTVVLGQVDHQCADVDADGSRDQTTLDDDVSLPKASHSYNGSDETVLNMLEKTYMNSLGDAMEISKNGPIVAPAKTRESVGSSWKSEPILVAHVQEHVAAINCVRVSPDHTFFVTCSDDGTIKLWDTAKLEKNVSNRARYTYRGFAGSKVKYICFLKNSFCMAAASDQGLIHILECKAAQSNTSEAKGIKLIKSYQCPAKDSVLQMIHAAQDQMSILLITTASSKILAIDLDKMSLMYELQNPVHHGMLTSLCANESRTWLLLGTSRGILDLWDLRFRLPVKSMGLPSGTRINSLCMHPSRGNGRYICVAMEGAAEITVWDIEKSICKEVFRPLDSFTEVVSQNYKTWNVDDQKPEELLAKYMHEISLDQTHSKQTIGARVIISAGLASKFQEKYDCSLISASTDQSIRRWDLYKVEQSSIISKPSSETERVIYQEATYSSMSIKEEVLDTKPASRQKAKTNKAMPASLTKHNEHLKAHMDIILDLAYLQWPYRMIISVDRSGVLKVFA